MSLDISLHEVSRHCVYETNITHNLAKMAEELGVYDALWHPKENGIRYAKDLIPLLQQKTMELFFEARKYKAYNASNGWGTYENFWHFLNDLLQQCKAHPEAEIESDI